MRSIKEKTIGIFIFISLMLTLVIYGIMKWELSKNIIPLNSSITQKFVDNRANEINTWFGERLSELRLLADLPKRHDYNQEQFFEETQALSAFDESNYLSIRLVTDDAISHSETYPEFSIADRKYYQTLQNNPTLNYTVSDSLSSKEDTHEAVIILYRLAKPLADGTSYLAAAVPLTKVNELAKNLNLYDGTGVLLGSGSESMAIDAKKEILFTSSIKLLPDWKINYIVSKNSLSQDTKQLMYLLLLILIPVLLLLGILLLFLFQQIIHPILSLRQTMTHIQSGNRQARVHIDSPTELADLGEMFNQTLDEVYTNEKKYNQASIRMLQEQIQPHFLYNTLDTIQWQVLGGNPKEAVMTIEYLSNYFRKGLNHGSEVITIQDELVHVKNYLEIQKIRHEELVDFEVTIPDCLLDEKVLHFILQPIVENAINHGLRKKKNGGSLHIYVSSFDEKFLQIQVINDGVKIPQEKVKTLNEASLKDPSGYGISNIHHRLKLFYHGKAQLIFKSDSQKTSAIFYLPRMEVFEDE